MSSAGHRRWASVRHEVKRQWNRLTDEDLDSVCGNTERLIEVLRLRHGYDRLSASREIDLWRQSLARRG